MENREWLKVLAGAFGDPIPHSRFLTPGTYMAEAGMENGESGMVRSATLALLTFPFPIPVSPFPAP
ncbi:hypothetical protein NB722_003204 [Xanthomonas sacchari]|nr:hypothetical protein [Xanthomonas sacchari]